MVGMTYAAVPMYRMFCQVRAWLLGPHSQHMPSARHAPDVEASVLRAVLVVPCAWLAA